MRLVNNRLLLLMLLLTVALKTLAQGQQATIKKQAEQMATALIQQNYSTVINYTYPKIVQMVGGKAKMALMLQEEEKQMGVQGAAITKVAFGEPAKVYTAGKELHCLIPQTITMKVKGGKVVQQSHLLAVSADGGKKWFFVDTARLTSQNATELFPSFNQALKIPTRPKPTFVKE